MSRLPAKYRLISRLDHDQAIQAIAEGANVKLDVFTLAQACADAGTPATVDLPLSGTSMWNGVDHRDFSGTQSATNVRRSKRFNDIEARITIKADGLSWETSIDLLSQPLWFAPAILDVLTDRLLGISAETGELQQLQHELEQERIARQSLELELTALREKPLDPRERASFERLLYVLAREANFTMEKPYADADVIIRMAELLGAKVPRAGTIASFLELAKARAESERES